MAEGSAKPGKSVTTRFGEGFVMDAWYFVALSRDLKPGQLRRYELMGEPVMLGRRRSGELMALRDICPHRAAPLSAGKMFREDDGAESVECPYHGWRFGADGYCTSIPSLVSSQDMDVARIRIRRYSVAESQGMIFVWAPSDARGAGEPDGPPPLFDGIVGGGPRIVDTMEFDTHFDHAIVGLMDPTHAPYVHKGFRTGQHDKEKRFEPSPEGFVMVRHEPSKKNLVYLPLGGEPLTEITFRMPGYRWEHIQVGKRQVMTLTCLTPLSETKTRITQITWSDHPAVLVLKPILAVLAHKFLKQDGDMVNLQNEGLRYDHALLWIEDADTQAKWYQQLKREWAASRAEGRAFVNPVEAATLRWRS